MNTNHISLMKPYYLKDASLHTMGSSLLRYLEMKVHEAILTTPHDVLIVRGCYDRSQSHISRKEKKDKLFNWQRPTTNFHKNTLYLNTYPSMDYVRHLSRFGCYLSTTHMQKPRSSLYSPFRARMLDTFLKSRLQISQS